MIQRVMSLRTAGSISGASYPSSFQWGGTSIGVNASATGITNGVIKTATNVFDGNGRICKITLGVDLATSVKISSGSKIEVFAKW